LSGFVIVPCLPGTLRLCVFVSFGFLRSKHFYLSIEI
jgi:hypothetical protein